MRRSSFEVSVSTLFFELPLRLLRFPAAASPSRWSSISAFKTRSAKAFFSSSNSPSLAKTACGSRPASKPSRVSFLIAICALHRRHYGPAHKIPDSPSKATPIGQLAFEGGEETLAHRIVVGVADRACRWTNAGFLAASAESDRRILRTAIRMMDDVVGLSGHDRHAESVEHDAGLQIGREGPSDDPARPGVENDRKVEKSGQRRQEVDVGHPQLVGSLGHEVAADEIAGGMMVCRLPCSSWHLI